MAVKITEDLKKIFDELLEKYPKDTTTNIAKRVFADKDIKSKVKLSYETFRSALNSYRKKEGKNLKPQEAPPLKEDTKKKSLEHRADGKITINWIARTVVTDLGEWGPIIMSFDMHSAVQRSYVYEENGGEGDTAAVVAMKFDFPHAKAVAVYAKLHGFTKSSPPQTDIEFAEGLTVEQAVSQNIQTLKRQTYKATERAKWDWIVKNHEKWLDFHHNVLKPFENHIEAHISKYKAPILDLKGFYREGEKRKFAGVLGLSDWHYMKLCYGPKGERIYDKEVTKERIKHDSEEIVGDMLGYGKPEIIYVPIGNDNIHVDGPEHLTTAGTPQINATDGIWRIGVEEYIHITLDYINSIAQVAPVEVMCFPGNHDEKTSQLLQVFLKIFFEDNKRVKINYSLHSRLYSQYQKNALIFTHGHHLGKQLPKEIHKIILGEAKDHGIDMNVTENYLLFSGHEHIGSTADLNGNVQQFVMPSFSGTDDFWHRGKQYVGRACESAGYIVDPVKGRKAIVYSS
jgi:hypothetical protein